MLRITFLGALTVLIWHASTQKLVTINLSSRMFKFHNPGRIKIKQRTADHLIEVDTSREVWHWEDAGYKGKIDFNIIVNNEVREILKAYTVYRLEYYAPKTVIYDGRIIKHLSSTQLGKTFPWNDKDIIQFAQTLKSQFSNLASFRKFYSWALSRSIKGFDKRIYLELQEIKIENFSDYEDILLRKHVLNDYEESQLIRWIEDPNKKSGLSDTIILQLTYELGPRPIQIHSLDISDFIKFEDLSNTYYSINLPMAKKIAAGIPEKRPRRISASLGSKIEKLIDKTNSKATEPLLRNTIKKNSRRFSSNEISKTITDCLKKAGLASGRNSRTLRHHFAQSLADQGAAAEVIAELLGHNSTVSAKYYVEATPTMAKIKTIALGKSDAFIDIINMLTTGEIIDNEKSNDISSVKGLVGSQYIGGIGACGLPEKTSCPKNPVYSCYTCKKFHPFANGKHSEVKTALQGQAQFFIDTASDGLDLEHNRTVTQLSDTIRAVDVVIHRINHLKGDS